MQRRCVYTIGMTMTPNQTKPGIDAARQPRRWAALLAGSVLLHLIILHWADGNIGLPSAPMHDHIMVADLRAPKAVEPAVLPRPKLSSKPVARPHKRPHVRPAPPIVRTPPAEPSAVVAAMPAPDAPAAAAPEDDALPDTKLVDQQFLPAKDESGADEQGGVHYKIDPAPSAELKYDVQSLREGQTFYGHGKIQWQTENGKYSVVGEAGVLFFSVLQFKSEGVLDDFGVAPVRYSEKRFRKSETDTHFNRDERNNISFSASTESYPRTGGEQDRASIVWQLAAIGRGDSGKFAPGAKIDLFVAGVRDAETWRIRVVGLEDIEVGTGKTIAWHVVRAPRAGSYDQQLDIWLSPEQQWYPVRLRYTETNGDYLDMSLSNLEMAQSGNPGTAAPR